MKCKLCGGEFYESRMVSLVGTIVLAGVTLKVEAKVCHTCSSKMELQAYSVGFKQEET